MREPDVKGPYGRAWFIRDKDPKFVDHQACLGSWLVNVPGAHPFWEYWLVTIVHLRDIPGQSKPATKKYPEAEFEFGIHSIDPAIVPEPDPDNALEGYPLLNPPDVIEQFHGISDRDALRVAEGGISAMIHGRISPDQDFRPMWNRLITGTVEHFRSGAHPEN
jgi:hypothetical protein